MQVLIRQGKMAQGIFSTGEEIVPVDQEPPLEKNHIDERKEPARSIHDLTGSFCGFIGMKG